MKAGWKLLPFEEVIADLSGGNVKTPQGEFLPEGQFAIVDQGKELVSGYANEEKRLCHADLPVIIFGDHTRCFKYVDFPFCMGADGVKVLRPKIDVNVKYLYYYLRQLHLTDAGYSRHFKYLKQSEVVLPPLEEQKRIADILDRAEALRAKRRAALAQLDELTKSIFVEMFGDPITNSKGWPKKPFSDVCVSRLGKMLDQKQQTGKHLRPYLRNANVQWFHFDLTEVFEMDFNEAAREEFRLEDGDLLVCEGGEPGRAAIWRSELEECYYQKALHRARPHPDLANSEYLAWLLWFLSDRGGLSDHVTAATIAHLTGEKLKAMKIPLPSIDLQKEFARHIASVEKLKAVHKASLAELNELYSTLQQRAFKGVL